MNLCTSNHPWKITPVPNRWHICQTHGSFFKWMYLISSLEDLISSTFLSLISQTKLCQTLLSKQTTNIHLSSLLIIFFNPIECGGGLVVSYPTRWSLFFIFGFLWWSSSWQWLPPIGTCKMFTALLGAGLTVFCHFFCKMYFLWV